MDYDYNRFPKTSSKVTLFPLAGVSSSDFFEIKQEVKRMLNGGWVPLSPPVGLSERRKG